MKKSLLVVSLAVMMTSVLGMHDRPFINRNQNHITRNSAPISNFETASERFDESVEMSDTEIEVEGNYSGATQGQDTSTFRKRKRSDNFTDFVNKSKDKRKRLVTLQDTISSLRAFSNGGMSNEKRIQVANEVISVTLDMDNLNFFSKAIQSQREVKECKEFVAGLSKMLGCEETEDYSALFGCVDALNKNLSESEKNNQQAIQQIDELNQQSKLFEHKINAQKAEIDELKQEKTGARQQLAKSKQKEKRLRKELNESKKNNQQAIQQIDELNQQSKLFEYKINAQKAEIDKLNQEKTKSEQHASRILGNYNKLKGKYNEIQRRRIYYKNKAESLEMQSTNQEDLFLKLQEADDLYRNQSSLNEDLNNENKKLKQSAAELEGKLNDLCNEKDRLNRLLDERGRELVDSRFIVNQLEILVDKLDGELDDSQCKTDQLKTSLDKRDRELNDSRCKTDQLKTSLDKRDKELNDSRYEIDQLKTSLDKRDRELNDLLDERDHLNRLLDRRDEKLKIFEYMNEINNQRITYLSEKLAGVCYEKDIKHVTQKLSQDQTNLRWDIYRLLQELQDKEWGIKKLKTVEKNLSDFLNIIILYKQNMTISEILKEWGIESKQNIAVIDEDLRKQDLKTKLDDLFIDRKIPDRIVPLVAYTSGHKDFLYDLMNVEIGRMSESFYEGIINKVRSKICDAGQVAKRMIMHIDKKIDLVRTLREEEVIQDFVERISEIEYFKDFIKYVDKHLDGYYEAILRAKLYEYKKK